LAERDGTRRPPLRERTEDLPVLARFLDELPGRYGLGGAIVHLTIGQIAESVGIYLGLPFAAGLATWNVLTARKGKELVSAALNSKD
jgi:ACR3 family arsenite efflux pump ArsB